MATPRQPVEQVRQCRFCGCTPENPCKIPGGDECAYLGEKADRCSAPGCVVAWEAEWDKYCADARARARLVRKLSKGKKKQYRRAA